MKNRDAIVRDLRQRAMNYSILGGWVGDSLTYAQTVLALAIFGTWPPDWPHHRTGCWLAQTPFWAN